jgi:hypothetical protein
VSRGTGAPGGAFGGGTGQGRRHSSWAPPRSAEPAVTGVGNAGKATGGRPLPVGPWRDRSGTWLRNAAIGLLVLAAGAAVVSFSAQYQLVYAARGLKVIAAVEAAIPDAAAVVFACLGIALALHGRRAVRARVLNVAAVGTSVFMNAIAAAPGWRSLAIWVMPPVAYALASDTLIGVVRAWAIARHQALDERLADEEATPLAAVGGLVLWLVRLALAPASTLGGFRAWVVEECPVAPGRRVPRPGWALASVAAAAAITSRRRPDRARGETKTARFLALATEEHGPLAAMPLEGVAKISAELAPQVGLNTGAARTALRRAVLAAQNGDPQ